MCVCCCAKTKDFWGAVKCNNSFFYFLCVLHENISSKIHAGYCDKSVFAGIVKGQNEDQHFQISVEKPYKKKTVQSISYSLTGGHKEH